MIETRLLNYFVTVANEKSFTGAANVLHVTQPTLSRQMMYLEDLLGTKLFERDSRPLRLTDDGLLLKRRAEEILAMVERTEEELSSAEEQVEGVVSIGCGELASAKILADWIAGFKRECPRVVFEIHTANADQIKQRMDNGLTDIGLLLEPIDMELFEYIRMPEKERWVAMMPSKAPLAKSEYVTAEALADIPVILPSRKKVLGEVANWFGPYYPKLEISCTCNLSTNAALLVQAGAGYALTIEGSMPFMDQRDVKMVPLYPDLHSTSVLAWRRGIAMSTAERRFIQYIKYVRNMEN